MGIITSLVNRHPNTSLVTTPNTSMAQAKSLPTKETIIGGAAIVSYNRDGAVRSPSSGKYRRWARTSEWVRGAIQIRRSQVSSADWDIVPYDQRRPYSKRLQMELKERLRSPNPRNDSFRSFIEMVVDDILTLDAGCIEKVRSLDGQVRELWPVDGAEVGVSALWDGDPKEARYFWYPNFANEAKARWKNDDFIYMVAHPRTDSPIGSPPLETLALAIESELNSSEYNRRQVAGAAPDGVMDLGEGMSEQQIMRFRSFFENEVSGRGALGFIGGTKGAQFINFHRGNREMQFLEWQIYLVRKIAVVMGLTPQDLGVTFDINRSTSEIQVQISEDRGLRPLMSIIQETMTQEYIWDRGFGGPDNNLAFRFTALNLKESSAKAEILDKALAGVPWRYVNEARIEEGREPIKGLDGKLIMSTPQGALDLSDVPTVREFLEMQNARRNPSPNEKNMETKLNEIMSLLEGKK